MRPALHFLGWNLPVSRLCASWLLAEPERLARRLVVVPTRNSGRNLQECLLAGRAGQGRGAVLGPRLAMPNDLFRPDASLPDAIRWAGWLEALRLTPESSLEELLPSGLADKGDAWKIAVARQADLARETLAAACLGFSDVAAALPEDARRWGELAGLEKAAVAAWEKWGHRDPVAAKRARAEEARRPQSVDEIVVAAVPDPTPLALRALGRLLESGLPVTVLVGAPEEFRDGFDEWGRPDPGFWAGRERHPTPEPTATVVAANAKALAQAAVAACAQKSNLCVAVGACDRTFLPALEREFREHGWEAFDPEDAPVAKDGWPDFLEALAGAVEGPDRLDRAVRLARHPSAWSLVEGELDVRAAVAALDARLAAHPTESAGVAARALMAGTDPGDPGAARLLEAVRGVAGADWTDPAAAFAGLVLRLVEADSAEIAGAMRAEMAAWPLLRAEGLGAPALLRWLSQSVGSLPRRAGFPPHALPLQGWLELSFDPAPHLVLAGMHEGAVPEGAPAGALLSEAVSRLPGLRNRPTRLARDVYLYTAMVEARRGAGSVTVVVAHFDPKGEPCKPSRLLLHAGAQEIPARVRRLVGPPDRIGPGTPPWERGSWILGAPAGFLRNRGWTSLSPTLLRDYLACPTRFYFKRVLGWNDFEPFSGELGARAYGDLLHAVLGEWGRDPALRDEGDEARLRKCWKRLLQEHVARNFPGELPPLLRLQVISAGERLLALARRQAEEHARGWRVVEAEREFNAALRIAGLPLRLKVDRVDRNSDTGLYRVVDYKTGRGDRSGPRRAHLRRWSEETCGRPLGPLIPWRGGAAAWTDLQLPLYAAAVGRALGAQETPRAAYALLPDSLADVGFSEFGEMDGLMESALAWAEAAGRGIVEGSFWPPVRRPAHDPFEAVAPEGLEAALGEKWGEFLA
jgi:ATP-dependent helicase/nuclease subunit B